MLHMDGIGESPYQKPSWFKNYRRGSNWESGRVYARQSRRGNIISYYLIKLGGSNKFLNHFPFIFVETLQEQPWRSLRDRGGNLVRFAATKEKFEEK